MKILYVATLSNTINAFMVPHIKMLLDQGHCVDIACNIQKKISDTLIEHGCKVYNVNFSRSPLSRTNYEAYKSLKKLIEKKRYNIVHTHTPVASAITRLVCRNKQDIKVIYTAHGFHFFKGAPLKNWLLYYPIERFLARYTDVLITINKEDYNRAKHFKAKKVEYVPGVGLDISKFSNVVVDKTEKRKELGIPKDAFVLLSVGELNKNKNHETIIKAVAKLNNPSIYYVICGIGPLEKYLRDLIKELGMEKQVYLLGFREDVNEICKVSDVFIFPSFREGLSVALMEAMASGLPVICSDIRGNIDLIENGKGGFLVDPKDVDGFVKAIEKLLKNEKLRVEMGQYNREIINNFELKYVLGKINKVYEEFIPSFPKESEYNYINNTLLT